MNAPTWLAFIAFKVSVDKPGRAAVVMALICAAEKLLAWVGKKPPSWSLVRAAKLAVVSPRMVVDDILE